jgi:sigma-B regulation protein RsbU (phosphoserine phosphatase)
MTAPPSSAAAPRPHRDRVAGTRETLRRLHVVTDAALSRLDVDALLAELLERTRDLLQADTAAIMLLDPEAGDLVATASSGLDDEIRRGLRVPLGEGFTGRIAATREPVILDHVDATTVVSSVLIDKHLASMAGVPMLASDRLLGVLHVGTLNHREFSTEDIDLLRLVADRAAMATQARLSQLDRSSTLALQRSLLPARPPAVAGFEVAARYIPGAAVGVGGDWYDLFTLPSGHIGVAIGDVAGSGLRAAVVMGRIRSALRAYALESDDPADVLTRLDRKIQLFEPDAMATAIYTVIDPTHSTLTMSVAGHLPALLIDPHGSTSAVTAPIDLPLGAYPNAPRHATTVPIIPRATVLFYTDGLVERRNQSVADGITQLRKLLHAVDPHRLCSLATDGMLGDTAASDDVAVLALRRTAAIAPAADGR